MTDQAPPEPPRGTRADGAEVPRAERPTEPEPSRVAAEGGTPLYRSRPHLVVAAIVALIEGALGFVPLFGGPGYESALATGIFLPSIVAVLVAIDLGTHRRQPFDAYCRGVGTGVGLALVALAVSLLHTLHAGLCDPWTGLENFALGPVAGAALAGAWGWVAAEIAGSISRRALRTVCLALLALAAPFASIAVSIGRFYTSPMIFAYDPFVGYFSGSIYDTVVDLAPLVSYRAGTAATLFAGFVFSLHLVHDRRGKLHYESIGRPGLLALGVASAIASLLVTASGAKLGHYQTRATIAEALGAALHGDRCDVVYRRGLPADRAARFLRECDEQVRVDEAWLGVSGTPHITAFLFESESQKQSLMGAGGTSIAKPWRHEVYVQEGSYPHRVLGHELMHVVAGDVGPGPFHVAGSLHGLLPDPGLIEGVATAASPKDDDLSPAEWARAMKELEILPPLSRLFALGFFGENSSTAYTVSGAFVGWVHDTFGADAVAAWYRGTPLPEVTKKSWADLENDWHASLDALDLPANALLIAKAKFDRPAIFGRKCPRTVDACIERSDELASGGDAEGAIGELRRAMELDPHDDDLRLDVAKLEVAGGDALRGRHDLEALANDEKLERTFRDRAIEELADLDLASGDGEAAAKRYEDVRSRTLDESKLRTLEVKIYAAKTPEYRDAIVSLLVGKPGKKPDRAHADEILAVLDATRPAEGLAAYLLARHDVDEYDYELAATRLDSALGRKIDVPHVRVEALRLRIVVACARREADVAAKTLSEYAKDRDAAPAHVDAMTRLVDRCIAGQ